MNSSALCPDPALMGRRNPHIFAVFGDRAAGHFDALALQQVGNLLIRKWVGGIFFFYHFFDTPLEDEQRSGHSAGSLHRLGEEITKFENPLRGMRILIRDGSTHS